MSIVILFVAHDGVSQPNIWELFKQRHIDENADIQFRVLAQADNKIKMGSEFVKQYRLQGDYCMKPTNWSSFSVVYEILYAFWVIYLELGGNFERIFLISGTDIPIVSLAQWIHDNPSKTANYAGGNKDKSVHSTWMSLTSNLVRDIIFDYLHYPDTFMDLDNLKIHERKMHRYRILKLFIDCNINGYYSRNHVNISLAMDETWLSCLPIRINLQSNGWIVLPLFRGANRVSPILWEDFETSQLIGQDTSINLHEYINISRFKRSTIPSLLTARKVSEKAQIPITFINHCLDRYDRATIQLPDQLLNRFTLKKQASMQTQMMRKFQRQKELSAKIIVSINRLSSLLIDQEEDSPIIDIVWQKLIANNFNQQAILPALENLRRNLMQHKSFLQSSSAIQEILHLAQKSIDYDDFMQHYRSRGCRYGCVSNKAKIAALKDYFFSRLL